ncbi:MAG: hypothetical protein Kow0056_16660 [Coriobacteriia bacterium]
MTRRRRRLIILIAILLLLLVCLGVWFVNYSATRQLDLGIFGPTSDALPLPQYMFSFSGNDQNRLDRPIGVYVDDDEDVVFVADARGARIFRFTLDGEFIDTFGEGEVVVPLYIAKNPKDGNLYITDRRLRTVHIYDTDGNRVGEFDPNLPEDQLPIIPTDRQWAPVAIEFSPEGKMYVTEILRGHRLLVFDEEGHFEKSAGTGGIVSQADQAPEVFQFPNGIAVHDDEVWVSDSNNRRMQVFDLDGNFIRLVPTEGLPRGVDFLNPLTVIAGSDDSTPSPKFVVVDTLAHDATIWDAVADEKLLVFGENGVLEGQFSYPNDVSVDSRNRMYITDTANARVQVWGWPEEVLPVPVPKVPQRWGWCLTPLLLLPLLLLTRKRRFFATKDFIDAMYIAEKIHVMPHKRRRWFCLPETYERIRDVEQDGVHLDELFEEAEWSESDVKSLMDRLEIERPEAIVLAVAQRMKVFCTEDAELRRLAKVLDIDVVNRDEFLDRFERGDKTGRSKPERT